MDPYEIIIADETDPQTAVETAIKTAVTNRIKMISPMKC